MLLCLDFDGVIADGVDECLIVSWLAWHQRPVPARSEKLSDSIPLAFHQKFKNLRNYVRRDEHFIVPYIITDLNNIQSQQDFDSSFAGFNPALVKDFTLRFQHTRSELRENHFDVWNSLHFFYPGIGRVLKSESEIFIVSGKDPDSIIALCNKHQLDIEKNHVYGGLASKTDVLKTLLAQSKENGRKMIFCDDNLPNVIESKSLGITTFWADWGYHTEEHLKIANNKAIVPTSISQLFSIVEDNKHHADTDNQLHHE